LASVKVGRRVGKGTERSRGSARATAGASPPKMAAALTPGACARAGDVTQMLAFSAPRTAQQAKAAFWSQ